MTIQLASDWWNSLSKEEQDNYIREHPNSKFAKTSNSVNVTKVDNALKKAYRKRDKIQEQINLVKKKIEKYKKLYELHNDSDYSSMLDGLENRLFMLEKDLSNVERFHIKPAELNLEN